MIPPKPLAFGGSDEELEKYLLEFARLAGGWAARDRKAGGWAVSGGALLSTNPNAVPWRLRVSRSEGGLSIAPFSKGLPWTRGKDARLARFRGDQLADYLECRARGLGPEKFDPARLREPFAPFGEGVAAITASYAWFAATAVSGFAAAVVAATLACLPLLAQTFAEIAERALALDRSGAIPLPTAAELASIGLLGSAIVFALPIAFFAAIVHAAAMAAGELSLRASRLPQASFLFLTILLALSFYPFLGLWALPLALPLPLGVHAGATLVWGRRRERIREGGRPRIQVVLIGVILGASLAGAVVPRPAEGRDFSDRLALFRDRWMLGSDLGRAAAGAYYRTTLVGAEPLKELYSLDDRRARLAQPLAACTDPALARLLRASHFAVVPAPPCDVVVPNPELAPPATAELREFREALDRYSQAHFRGKALREVYGVAWRSVYYAGPLALLLALMGVFAPAVSILFRRLPPKLAVISLCGVLIVSTLLLALIERPRLPLSDDDLAERLADPEWTVRHEAAQRAFRLDSTAPLADALLKAAEDPELRVRLWACAALGRSGDARAFAAIAARLDDPSLFVRYRAAEGLGLLRDPRAIEPLERMMRTRSWYEGVYALAALRRLRPGQY